MRLLVCGGRHYSDRETLYRTLDNFRETIEVSVVIEGQAPGADTMALEWAQSRGIAVHPYPADWERYGRAAGPIRNKQMLDLGKPDYGIAFYDRPRDKSRGTANMVSQLKKAGIPVMEVGP